MFKYKKKLGQHFLRDKNIARKIVEIADIQENEVSTVRCNFCNKYYKFNNVYIRKVLKENSK